MSFDFPALEFPGRIHGCDPSKSFGMVLDAKDQDLIEACRRGDYDAFRLLFEGYKDRVYSIALRYSGDRAAAMDIAQDSFLKVLSAIRHFQGNSSFDSWLYRIVVNTCLDYKRSARRVVPFLDGLLDAFAAPAENILNRLVRTEQEETVQSVVAKLPHDQRIVVVLRYTEGLSYDQIAEIVGCSAGTVGSRLNRAHKILGRRLGHLRWQGGRNG
jgi:RNA polymerase sigma-70 factor (ECF subfamily)